MKTWNRAVAAVVAAGLVVFTAAAAKAVEPGPLITPAARDQVKNELIARGVTSSLAAQIVADDDSVQAIPMTVETESSGLPLNTDPNALLGASAPADSAPQEAIGQCSGSSRTGTLRAYYKNNFGQRVAYVQLVVPWCYNGTRVTWAASQRTYYIYAIAKPTWTFRNWTDFQQYFYTSSGHANGGVFTSTTGHFDICLLKVGCVTSVDPYLEQRGYYNGTWLYKVRK